MKLLGMFLVTLDGEPKLGVFKVKWSDKISSVIALGRDGNSPDGGSLLGVAQIYTCDGMEHEVEGRESFLKLFDWLN